MSDPTNPQALTDSLVTAAQRALAEGKWILCATLCRTIDELQIEAAVAGGARAAYQALTETTRAVPLLKVPMRDDQPRTPVQGLEGEPFATAPCGGCGATVIALEWHQEFIDVERDPARTGLPYHQRETVPGMVEFDGWRHQAPPTDPLQIIGHDAVPAYPVTPTARGRLLMDTRG